LSYHLPILLVEDNPVTRKVLAETVGKAGHEVVEVENGKRALETMNKSFCPIVMTDWIMPEMDGIELCKAIRQNENNWPSYVFIILLTIKDSQHNIIAGLEAGADDYLVKPINRDELIARLNNGKRFLEVERSLRLANEKIKILSLTDPLTECYNRRYIEKRLPDEIKRARRYNRSLSIVMCDIDRFKKVNDNYGHHFGDLVLQQFSKCIKETIRSSSDWVVRYGGEEFLMVFPETNFNDAVSMVKRFKAKLCLREVTMRETKIVVTASYGVTGFDHKTPEEKISTDAMIEMADKYLYQAKQAGGDMIKAGAL
jgi:diguanylate cyclase (GGDEF)-like protein